MVKAFVGLSWSLWATPTALVDKDLGSQVFLDQPQFLDHFCWTLFLHLDRGYCSKQISL